MKQSFTVSAGFLVMSQFAGLSPVPFMPLGVMSTISGARLRSPAVLGTCSPSPEGRRAGLGAF